MKKILLFEDSQLNFLLPISYFKHIAEIKFGCLSNTQRWHKFNFDVELHGRNYLDLNKNSDSNLFVNSRVIPERNFIEFLNKIDLDILYTFENIPIVFKSSKKNNVFLENGFINEDYTIKQEITTSLNIVKYPWDFVYKNAYQLKEDSKFIENSQNEVSLSILINEKDIKIHSTAKIYPQCVLNAENGPIIIDESAIIMPFSYIEGPVYIGKETIVKSHSRIAYSSIFNNCKVAGEIANSVISDFSNKAHDGYLGHSFLGSWVNLGAMTTNSNLKNNYSPINLDYYGTKVNLKEIFLGLIIGDYSKSAIGTLFNTSTIVGTNANIFGEKKPNKNIKSFSWGTDNLSDVYDIEKAIETTKRIYKRRNLNFTDKDSQIFKQVFDFSQSFEKKATLK